MMVLESEKDGEQFRMCIWFFFCLLNFIIINKHIQGLRCSNAVCLRHRRSIKKEYLCGGSKSRGIEIEVWMNPSNRTNDIGLISIMELQWESKCHPAKLQLSTLQEQIFSLSKCYAINEHVLNRNYYYILVEHGAAIIPLEWQFTEVSLATHNTAKVITDY